MLRWTSPRILLCAFFALSPLALSGQQIFTFIQATSSTNSVVDGQLFTLTATLGVEDPTQLAATNGLPVQFIGLDTRCTATLQNGVASCQAAEELSDRSGDELFAEFNGNAAYGSSSYGPIDIGIYTPGSNVGPALQGAYAFYFDGYTQQPGATAKRVAAVGSLTADGVGKLAGTLDYNSSTAAASKIPVTGTYTINTGGQGTVTLTTSLFTLHFDLYTGVPVTTGVQSATMMESDGSQLFGTGRLRAQTVGFNPGYSGTGTHYSFHLAGETACTACDTDGHESGPVVIAGTSSFQDLLSSPQVQFSLDQAIGTGLAQQLYPGGTYTVPDASGRMTLQLTFPTGPEDEPTNFVAYLVNANKLFLMSTDPHADYILLLGEADQ